VQDYETKHFFPWMINSSFEDAHVRAAETVAKVAVEEGATCLIHVSALAADPYSISAWARSKAAGACRTLTAAAAASAVGCRLTIHRRYPHHRPP